jgi:chloride channel protein, CIC family
LPMHYMWWPVIGGAVIGLGGLLQPRALGVGYDTIRDLLAGHLVGAFVLGLVVTKAVIWAVALGSGTSGGVLAPLLIMGGALGAIEAQWIHIGDASLWAIISMAAMMGGTMRSPLTAIAFLLELTHDMEMLPGLLVGCVAAHAVTVLLMKRSILTEKVARRGYHVVREYSVSPLARFRVEDVMERDVPTIPSDICGMDIVRRLLLEDPVFGRRHSWPLTDRDGALVGILTRGDLLEAFNRDGDEDLPLLEIGTTPPVVAYPDDQLEDALNIMLHSGVGHLPVVDRRDPSHLVGMLGRESIAMVYRSVLDEEQNLERGSVGASVQLGAERLSDGAGTAA